MGHVWADAVAGESAPITAPVTVIDGFLRPDVARAIRSSLELHLGNPAASRLETWGLQRLAPGQLSLRTAPERVIEPSQVKTLVGAIRDWSIRRLGFATVSMASLCLHGGGAGGAIHGAPQNGAFGFAYFLTDPDRPGEGRHLAIKGLEPVEAAFNRLVVFDHRLTPDLS